MMALLVTVRRLQRSSLVFLPRILSQKISSPSRSYLFSETFHRTFIVTRCNAVSLSSRFSTLQSSPNQEFHEILDFNRYIAQCCDNTQVGLCELIESVQKAKNFQSGDEALDFIDKSGARPSKDVIFSAILSLREEWKLAFLVFRWGERWDCIVEKTWCLITWVLANHTKFGIAWTVISNLHKKSRDTQQAILIMIDRYAAANLTGKATQAFQIMKNFSLSSDNRAYFAFLNILCKYGNIEEAEEFMFLNKKLFPLETEGFNIILNGWCNITIDIFEAKRVWREMSKCCILPNEISYSHMISCFSQVHNLFDSLRLFDEMKKRGFIPGLEVYNSLVYVLASENCLKEALNVVDMMKEAGLQPDSTTYNSMIRPLCGAAKLEEARKILSMMIGENISPTVHTYHALLQCASIEGAVEVLNHMKNAGVGPNKDTFFLILKKFSELRQPENVLKAWKEMKQYDIEPDAVHYTILVQGLVKCGVLAKAREFFTEMISKGIPDDPKLKKLLKEPIRENGGQGAKKEIKEARGSHSCRSDVIEGKRYSKNSSRKGNLELQILSETYKSFHTVNPEFRSFPPQRQTQNGDANN